MHEKFVAGIITQIRPWIGELETRPKTSKLMVLVRALYFNFYQEIYFIGVDDIAEFF
jgi:hypothetical protein